MEKKITEEGHYRFAKLSEKEYLASVGEDGIRCGSRFSKITGESFDLEGIMTRVQASTDEMESALGFKMDVRPSVNPQTNNDLHYSYGVVVMDDDEVGYCFSVCDLDPLSHCRQASDPSAKRDWVIVTRKVEPTRFILAGRLGGHDDKMLYKSRNNDGEICVGILDMKTLEVSEWKAFEGNSSVAVNNRVAYLKKKYDFRDCVEIA